MRIGGITLSPVAFYSDPLWNISYAYKTFLLTWRILELSFITARFLLIRAPFLLVWTRLPMTKDISLPGPYKDLQGILAPEREAKVAVAGGRAGTMQMVDRYRSIEDVEREQAFLRTIIKPPNPINVAIGGVIRGLVAELGSVWIKLAQIVSMRPEVPPFIRQELAMVQDRLPGVPPKEVKTILERELMKPVGDIFEWVNYEPIAAASLASVHHAKLRTGEEVALKIQRPFLQGIVALDTVIILNILLGSLRLLFPKRRQTDLGFFTLSFESALKREINFELEGHIQEIARDAMMKSEQTADYMIIAKVFFEHTTTKLLTMEFVHGIVRIDDLFDLPAEDIWEVITTKVPGMADDLPVHILVLGSRFPMHLGWTGGLFHGDLHLANIMAVRPRHQEDHWRFFLCDFGMFEDVSRKQFRAVTMLLWGLLAGEPERALDGLIYCHLEAGGKLSDVDWKSMYTDFLNFGRMWVEKDPEEESGMKIRQSKLHEGGITRHLLALLYSRILGGGLQLPYWLWLVLKSYLYEEEAGASVMGGSYDWWGWIFDQYSVRIEKDSVLTLCDRTNVFTMKEIPDALEPILIRGSDCENVTRGLAAILDEIKQEQIPIIPTAPLNKEAKK